MSEISGLSFLLRFKSIISISASLSVKLLLIKASIVIISTSSTLLVANILFKD